MPLPRAFYLRPPRRVARDLLGCLLVARTRGVITAGRIVETEAYLGPEDAASHAAFRPGSHALLYGLGGHAYVFVNYGMHFCFNAVAQRAGRPGCILVRALEPVAGAAVMARRRGVPVDDVRLASGPGNLTRALGITIGDNGADLTGGRLTIEPPDTPRDFTIAVGPRVGITRAADLPLRYWIAGNRYVSRRTAVRSAETAPARPGRTR
ncbi:MAG: DNA-3-methyladenine glycosylase [Candidatus Rokubacteria bacterium]|nr:DNA-3-methyladenine glycosylase [Candidatus Rokubacteria bacterium]